MVNLLKRFSLLGILLGLSILFQNCQQSKGDKIVAKRFYLTGEMKHEISMKDSMLHGVSTTYYKNGAIKYEKDFYNDIPVNDHYYYSTDGKLLGYNFYDVRGNLRYQILWDSLTGSYSQDGESLYLQRVFKQNYEIGDTINLIPVVANPFNSTYSLNFILDEQEITKSYESNDKKSPLLIYSIKEGVNLIKINSSIFDEENNNFSSDSISLEIIGTPR